MKKYIIVLIVLLAFLIPSLEVNANGLPYTTYTYSSANSRFVFTQDAYLPLSISYDLGGLTLDTPSDLTIDEEDNVYIADSGNSRIIKYSLKDDVVTIIGDGILEQPTGVHSWWIHSHSCWRAARRINYPVDI